MAKKVLDVAGRETWLDRYDFCVATVYRSFNGCGAQGVLEKQIVFTFLENRKKVGNDCVARSILQNLTK